MQHPPKVNKAKDRPSSYRHRRRLILLGIAIAVSLTFVLLLPQVKRLFPPPRPADIGHGRNFEVLDKVDPAGLASITVTHLSGETYTLRHQEGRLLLERPGQNPAAIQEVLAEKIIAATTSITVEDTVTMDEQEVREHLGDMGLDPPQIQVLALYQDGRKDGFSLGWMVPETGYYYFRWSGDPGVYMCDEGVYNSFEYTAQMLLPVPQLQLEKTLINRISLSLKGQEALEVVFATDSQGYQTATLQKPFAYPLDQDIAQGLLTAAAQLRLGTRRDDINGENSGQYGFDDPIAQIEIFQQEGVVQQAEMDGTLASQSIPEQTLRLTLGEKVGDFFYTCRYEGAYYNVSSLLAGAFLEVTAEEIVTKQPADLGDREIASISIQMEVRVLELRKTRTEQVLPNNQLATDASGNPIYDVHATLNGEVIAVETFDTLVERLKSLQVSGQVGREFLTGTGTPRWQLSLTTQGGTTRTMSAYPMDAFFDAIAVDGVVRYSLHGEALQIALADLVE